MAVPFSERENRFAANLHDDVGLAVFDPKDCGEDHLKKVGWRKKDTQDGQDGMHSTWLFVSIERVLSPQHTC